MKKKKKKIIKIILHRYLKLLFYLSNFYAIIKSDTCEIKKRKESQTV